MLTGKQIEKYLSHLGMKPHKADLKTLNELVKSQLIKFPFENISKLILQEEEQLNSLVEFDTHLNNSIEFGLGGTCYPCNYYFNQLLKHIGYDAELHGSRMGKQKDVHLVSLVKFNSDIYHIDVGYGAPFFRAIAVNSSPIEIKWGNLFYKLNCLNDTEIDVYIEKKNERVHGYAVNYTPRQISHFTDIIADSFSPGSEFMKCLRLFRFFDDYGIELKNNRYIIHKGNNSVEYLVKNINELKEVAANDFQLPNIPVEKAVYILQERKHTDIFEE